MLAHNDAEQVVMSYLSGAAADTEIAVVSKKIVVTISAGATEWAVGDKFTMQITSNNPPTAAAPSADSGNTGNGSMTTPTVAAGTLVGRIPEETWTFTCTTAGGDGTAKFKVVGSKSGAQSTELTSGSAYTITLQTIASNDEVIGALHLSAGAVSADVKDKITVGSGSITCSTNTSGGTILLIWRDVSAG